MHGRGVLSSLPGRGTACARPGSARAAAEARCRSSASISARLPDRPRRLPGAPDTGRGGPTGRPQWIDWPDFRTPRDGHRAAELIGVAFRRALAGERVEVACGGGVGRTGTVIACLAVLAGHPAADAVGWARRHYRPRAVETPGQRRWIAWFAEHGRPVADL